MLINEEFFTVHDKIKYRIYRTPENALENGGNKMEEKQTFVDMYCENYFLHVCISAHLLSAAVM